MKKISTLIYFFCWVYTLSAQLQGLVTSTDGEALPFANIYIEGTSNGTTTNAEGEYFFDLTEGDYQVVFQYIGYQQKTITVSIEKIVKILDVTLELTSIELSDVVVDAYAEDPAYAIIRKAIAKRNYYKNQIQSYSCDAYVKGNQKMVSAPEKIFGQEIGDMDGSLDSNRQGIIYLSESLSKLYIQLPNKVKEEMISSKLSGDDNGFSFNQASMMDFNFYDNHIEIERALLSPIANTAMQYYDYELIGTFEDKKGHLINKIAVLPKRVADPVFSGHIYIVEDLWNLQGVDVMLSGAAIKQPILDTLFIKQIYIPLEKPDVWQKLSQTLDFSFGLMRIEVEGQYVAMYSNYNLHPTFSKKFFSNEIFKVNENANKKTRTYWDSIRPLPLTIEEKIDYVRKDSIHKIRTSKSYLDSIDTENNQLETLDFLTAYTWRNSHKKERFTYRSPFSSLQFNPIQGFNGNFDFEYHKRYDDHWGKWVAINPKLQYGFGDKKLLAQLGLVYNFNRTKYTQLRISGGSKLSQFNNTNPIHPFINSAYSLILKENFAQFYKNKFAKISFRHEILNGLLFQGALEYTHRNSLQNTTNYSFFNKLKGYENNWDVYSENFEEYSTNSGFIFDLSLRIRFAQKYLSYPNRKIIEGSKYPTFIIQYRKGIPTSNSPLRFNQLRLSIFDDYQFGLVGRSSFKIEGGTFFQRPPASFLDYQHFLGNQTVIGNPSKYLTAFKQLSYYDYSTATNYLQAHYQHHFDGYLLDKLPLIRHLGWKSVVGTSLIFTKSNPTYQEISFGLDNIGIGALRFLRVDMTAVFETGKYQGLGFLIGVKI